MGCPRARPRRDALGRVLMRCSPWWPVGDERKSCVSWSTAAPKSGLCGLRRKPIVAQTIDLVSVTIDYRERVVRAAFESMAQVLVGGWRFRRYPVPLFRITNRGCLVDRCGWELVPQPSNPTRLIRQCTCHIFIRGVWRELSFHQSLVSGSFYFKSTAAASSDGCGKHVCFCSINLIASNRHVGDKCRTELMFFEL